MLQNAKFYLINNISKKLEHQHTHTWKFVEQAKISPFTTDDVNHKACKNLEVRLADQLPHTEWSIKVAFNGFKSVLISHATIQPGSVVLSGEILKRLHSLILYNAKNARLKMKLSLEFSMQSEVCEYQKDPQSRSATIFKHEIELLPRIDGKGNVSYDDTHTTNAAHQTSLEAEFPTEESKRYLSIRYTAQLSSLNVWVEGFDYNFSYMSQPDIMVGQKRLLETGLCSDVTIRTMDNEEIPCHKIILIGQSSVIETMFRDEIFVEGKAGEIPMKDRSNEEIMSFLAFLYYGDLKKALADTDLAVTLTEMGHYYDVQGLENGIKPVLLSRPAESFEVDAALRLFTVACGLNDLDLMRKVADVLERRDNEELFRSPLFKQLSAGVLRELFAMSRRMC